MDVDIKVIKKGHDAVSIKCPNCAQTSTVYFENGIVVDANNYSLQTKNQLKCDYCRTMIEVKVKKGDEK